MLHELSFPGAALFQLELLMSLQVVCERNFL
jgi:hypothetical protein